MKRVLKMSFDAFTVALATYSINSILCASGIATILVGAVVSLVFSA
ncbi:MAG: hypothetical protein ACFFB5_13780 [Promethearchaeota archaeon]